MPFWSPMGTRHAHGAQSCMQTEHPYTKIKIKAKKWSTHGTNYYGIAQPFLKSVFTFVSLCFKTQSVKLNVLNTSNGMAQGNKTIQELGVVGHTRNPSFWESEAGGSGTRGFS